MEELPNGHQECLLINTQLLGRRVNIRWPGQEDSLPIVAANPRQQHSSCGHPRQPLIQNQELILFDPVKYTVSGKLSVMENKENRLTCITQYMVGYTEQK